MERSRLRSRQGGFSLLETLLVVAILGLVIAITVPSMISSLRSAREARAIANCRAIGSSELAYYAHTGRFGIFNSLFVGRFLGEQFERRVRGTAASEVISDGAYEYSIRFAIGAEGVSTDADPVTDFRSTHRWFRCRVGRAVAGGLGGEGTMYYAPPGTYSASGPATSSYVVLGG